MSGDNNLLRMWGWRPGSSAERFSLEIRQAHARYWKNYWSAMMSLDPARIKAMLCIHAIVTGVTK